MGIQIDDDWKKQAQEEKRKLAEQAAAKTASAAAVAPISGAPARSAADAREAPQASFSTLVRSLMTQVLLYLGEISVRGGESMLNLDMAKYQLDLLGVLEDKCKGNLSGDEQKLIDLTLFDLRSRYVSAASQYIM